MQGCVRVDYREFHVPRLVKDLGKTGGICALCPEYLDTPCSVSCESGTTNVWVPVELEPILKLAYRREP
jgi:hypothetical protein